MTILAHPPGSAPAFEMDLGRVWHVGTKGGSRKASSIHEVGLGDLHPPNKREVGHRLALCALAKTYDRKDLVYSGPLYRHYFIRGDRIVLEFDHVGSGLASRNGQPLDWFEIAGEDGKFVSAMATIEGSTVSVSSPHVPRPVAVRFGWEQLANPNLMNREGLPASPFRTP
ncbi:MAG: hypothetical protein O2931_01190 [Planctomycetota bacterium]|nr:hypothetical protein [Planctomycetota bacterium]MDA1177387.1 hypothetical protein [Planctomycetota bacterium]